MRFSTVVLFAAAAIASKMPDYPPPEESSEAPMTTYEGKPKGHGKHKTTSTIYETTTYTVLDCPETVTKCPHDKTKVVTSTISVSTTVCDAEEETETAYPTKHEYPHEYPDHNKTMTYKPYPTKETPTKEKHPTWPTEKPEPECPYTKVKTISTSYTTVIPTVIYETYTEECAKPQPTKDAYPSSEPVCSGYNCSSPAKPYESKPVTAGAASAVGSIIFAAAAGLAAYALA